MFAFSLGYVCKIKVKFGLNLGNHKINFDFN